MMGMITVHVSIGTSQEPGETATRLLNLPSGRASVLFFTLSGALSTVCRNGRDQPGALPAVAWTRRLRLAHSPETPVS
jgi:hypothetical protein